MLESRNRIHVRLLFGLTVRLSRRLTVPPAFRRMEKRESRIDNVGKNDRLICLEKKKHLILTENTKIIIFLPRSPTRC